MKCAKQVNRKKFLVWSGLVSISAFIVPGRFIPKRDKFVLVDSTGDNNLQTMSRIRPARGAVEHGTV